MWEIIIKIVNKSVNINLTIYYLKHRHRNNNHKATLSNTNIYIKQTNHQIKTHLIKSSIISNL